MARQCCRFPPGLGRDTGAQLDWWDNPLLADVVLDILQQAVQVEQRLKRIGAITTTRTKEKPA